MMSMINRLNSMNEKRDKSRFMKIIIQINTIHPFYIISKYQVVMNFYKHCKPGLEMNRKNQNPKQ